jgi:aspartate/methionine/tyrosine aminotransferase
LSASADKGVSPIGAGESDGKGPARRIVREARIGLAPGIAFGSLGEGRLSVLFAQSPDLSNRAMDRLEPVLTCA